MAASLEPGRCADTHANPGPGTTILPACRFRQEQSRTCRCCAAVATNAALHQDRRIAANRGAGSNQENNNRPARKPPICACQATTWSPPVIGNEPSPNRILIPNHTARKASTRGSRRHAGERERRHAIGGGVAVAPEAERTAALERKAHRRRHRAGDRRRRADHRRLLAGMRDQMHRRAGRRRHREEREEPQRAEPPRHRAAERQQPDRIDAEMHPVGVDQRIGDEGPQFARRSRPAARRRAHRGVVARRNEGEGEQEFDVLLRRSARSVRTA